MEKDRAENVLILKENLKRGESDGLGNDGDLDEEFGGDVFDTEDTVAAPDEPQAKRVKAEESEGQDQGGVVEGDANTNNESISFSAIENSASTIENSNITINKEGDATNTTTTVKVKEEKKEEKGQARARAPPPRGRVQDACGDYS